MNEMVSLDGTFMVVFLKCIPKKFTRGYLSELSRVGAPYLRHEGATCAKSPVCILVSLIEFNVQYLNPLFIWCMLKSPNLAL